MMIWFGTFLFKKGVMMEKERFPLTRTACNTPEWLLLLTVNEEGEKVYLALVRPNRTTKEFARLNYN